MHECQLDSIYPDLIWINLMGLLTQDVLTNYCLFGCTISVSVAIKSSATYSSTQSVAPQALGRPLLCPHRQPRPLLTALWAGAAIFSPRGGQRCLSAHRGDKRRKNPIQVLLLSQSGLWRGCAAQHHSRGFPPGCIVLHQGKGLCSFLI